MTYYFQRGSTETLDTIIRRFRSSLKYGMSAFIGSKFEITYVVLVSKDTHIALLINKGLVEPLSTDT